MKLKVEKLVTLGCIVSQELVPIGCIVYPRRLVVPRSLRVVKLRGRFGSPQLSCGCVPQNVVRAPDSALKDSDSGR